MTLETPPTNTDIQGWNWIPMLILVHWEMSVPYYKILEGPFLLEGLENDLEPYPMFQLSQLLLVMIVL